MRRLTLAMLLVFLVGTIAFGQITPSQDVYTSSAAKGTNYGPAVTLGVANANSVLTTYIQFDLSEIPSGYTGSNIAKATLKLYVNTVTAAGSFNVDYVNGTWVENSITYNLAPALGGTIAASIPLTTANVNDYILIDVTPALQAWLNGSELNDGIALVGNSPLNATFDSKESSTQSHPPELDVVFAGATTSITGTTTASGSGLIGGGTSGNLHLALTNACATKQILQWSGSAWACAAAGTGTITGVIAGTDLTGGGTSGNVTLNVDTTKVPQLATANTFTGNQTVNGNLSATGVVTGNSYQIGSDLFAFGSNANTNSFLGFAGNIGITGTYNTAVGAQALQSGTAGGFNTSVGAVALQYDTSGGYNTAVGARALRSDTSGSFNTTIGVDALYYNSQGAYNTASGAYALGQTTSGIENTGVGVESLYTNVTGSGNTAIGYQAGLISTGVNSTLNTFVGTAATASGLLYNASAIGAFAFVSATDSMVLGSINGVNGATSDTSVGIGTTAPQALFHIDHKPLTNGQDLVLITSGKGADVGSLLLQNTAAGGLRLRAGAGTGSAYLASSGSLGFYTKDFGTPNTPNGLALSIDTLGNVNIPGNLSKGGGSFKIDDPLDPANKYLYHSFVESPDMMNIYNGMATLDGRGAVWITLPEYFEALNRDFRYQLTSIGRSQPELYISKEVSGRRFRIAGGKPGGRVSWQVTGIRQDAYANAHRIPVEEEKPALEQGRYLHPELFGASRELTIGLHP